jgi:hypothetical protein
MGGPRAYAWVATVLLPVVAMTSAGCQSRRTPAAEFIGAQYPPAPAGATIEVGATIGSADTARYALANVKAGDRRLVWLGRRLGNDAPARYEVLDVLELDERGSTVAVVFATCGTRRPGVATPREAADVVADPEIVAVGPFAGNDEVHTRVGRAWRADRRAGKLVALDPAGVVCFHEGG